MKQLRENGPDATVILDSGNLLFKGQRVQHAQEALTAVGLMDIYRLMNYDAVAVGPSDLAAGIGLLKKGLEQGFPWLSANITDENNRPIFPATKVLDRGGMRIGIVALSGAPSSPPQGVRFADWRKVLPPILESKTGQSELLVVLSSLEENDNRELLELFPQIHILITANRQLGNLAPRLTGKTLVTQTSPQGKYLGVLNVAWLPDQGWSKDLQQELMTFNEQLGIISRRILRVKNNSVQQGAVPDQALLQLEQEKQKILAKLQQTEKELRNRNLKHSAASSFDGSFIPLTGNLPLDPEISQALDSLKEKITTDRVRSIGSDPSPNASSSQGVPPGNVGSGRCAGCHPQQTEFWQSTGHAQAYATLQRQNQHFNLDCLPCHVTHTEGGNPAGQPAPPETLLSLPENLRMVGCEMCHGPGANHANNPEKSPVKKTVEPSTCLTCHTADHDTDFDYQRMISAISCPSG